MVLQSLQSIIRKKWEAQKEKGKHISTVSKVKYNVKASTSYKKPGNLLGLFFNCKT